MSIKIIKEEKKIQLNNSIELEEFIEDLNIVVKMINGTEGSNLISIDLTTTGMIIDAKIKYSIEHEE